MNEGFGKSCKQCAHTVASSSRNSQVGTRIIRLARHGGGGGGGGSDGGM